MYLTMMINLRKMKQEEFPAYRDYFINDYGKEITENYGHSLTRSLQIAQQELEEDLPLNITTPEHYLFCIELDKKINPKIIGYMWYKKQENDNSIFIMDFYIYEKHQNKGYGTASIEVLEKKLSNNGVNEIKLRVAFGNKRALALYKKLGFNITGYNMIKKI